MDNQKYTMTINTALRAIPENPGRFEKQAQTSAKRLKPETS
jgi:hypothetical protein